MYVPSFRKINVEHPRFASPTETLCLGRRRVDSRWPCCSAFCCYWIALAVDENTVLAFEPIKRIVPTTMTRITANITAYSAISWASSSNNTFQKRLIIFHLLSAKYARRTVQTSVRRGGGQRRESEWIASEVGWPSPQCTMNCAPPKSGCQAKPRSQTRAKARCARLFEALAYFNIR